MRGNRWSTREPRAGTLPSAPVVAPPRHSPAGAVQAIARHVSAEGCQFILSGQGLAVGHRYAFSIGGGATIAGTVRWVLRDRAGFAFDHPIDADAVEQLSRHYAALTRVVLHPC